MNSIFVERATADDASALLAVYEPYVLNTAITFEYEVPSVEEFANRIESISAKYPYLKAVDDQGNILGYAYANTFKARAAYDWAVETTIYVNQNCRGQGVGKLLYSELESKLKRMGIINVNACIAVLREDQPMDEHLTNGSVYFHEKQGYTQIGRFNCIGYKFETWYDMIWMEKMLGEHTVPQPVRFGDWV